MVNNFGIRDLAFHCVWYRPGIGKVSWSLLPFMINVHINHESRPTRHQSPREGLQHDRRPAFFDRHITRLSKAVFLLLHEKKTLFSSSNSAVGSEKTINRQARVWAVYRRANYYWLLRLCRRGPGGWRITGRRDGRNRLNTWPVCRAFSWRLVSSTFKVYVYILIMSCIW